MLTLACWTWLPSTPPVEPWARLLRVNLSCNWPSPLSPSCVCVCVCSSMSGIWSSNLFTSPRMSAKCCKLSEKSAQLLGNRRLERCHTRTLEQLSLAISSSPLKPVAFDANLQLWIALVASLESCTSAGLCKLGSTKSSISTEYLSVIDHGGTFRAVCSRHCTEGKYLPCAAREHFQHGTKRTCSEHR